MGGLPTSNPRYTEKFKIEAFKQVANQGHYVEEIAARLGAIQWLRN